jgi:hypothetical protein
MTEGTERSLSDTVYFFSVIAVTSVVTLSLCESILYGVVYQTFLFSETEYNDNSNADSEGVCLTFTNKQLNAIFPAPR